MNMKVTKNRECYLADFKFKILPIHPFTILTFPTNLLQSITRNISYFKHDINIGKSCPYQTVNVLIIWL